jgi:hypothetical protein
MISLLKALFPGALLTWIVSLFIGSGGSRGGFLYIHQTALAGYEFYWSWPLFIAGTGLAWALFLMMK